MSIKLHGLTKKIKKITLFGLKKILRINEHFSNLNLRLKNCEQNLDGF
jgi:hypothetical protein